MCETRDTIDNAGKNTATKDPSYIDVVLSSQEKWRSLKKNNFTALPFSQGKDLSSFFSNQAKNIITENLPTYVDRDAISRSDSLPQPIISFGTLADNRFYENTPVFTQIRNGSMDEEQQLQQERGMNLLNEIAIDTLAEDTLQNIGKKNLWLSLIATYLKIDNPIRPSYIDGLKKTRQLIGNNTDFDSFRTDLIASSLSGDTSIVNSKLKKLGQPNLDGFSTKLGGISEYNPLEGKLLNLLNKSEKLRGSLSGGFLHNTFPGVIFAPQTSSILYAMNLGLAAKYSQELPGTIHDPLSAVLNLAIVGLTSYLGLKTGLILPHIITHEMMHYFSSDIDHWGLKSVEYNTEALEI